MGKVESIIKSEIQRLAKREIKSAFLPLKREVRAMRLKMSGLSKSFKVLDRLAREQMSQKAGEKFKLEASSEEVKSARITPARIRNIRKKLAISQRELAILTGVSMGAVVMWEKGKFKPQTDKKGALIALRKLGKRNVKKMLAERKESEEPKSRITRRKVTRNARKGGRKGNRQLRKKRP